MPGLRMSRALVTLAVPVVLCTCSGGQRQSVARSDTSVVRAPDSALRDKLDALIDSLAKLPGQFTLVGAQWRFSGNQESFRLLASHGDSAVAKLIDCLDRTDSSAVTVYGRRVVLGAICYAALQRMAYPTEEEDGAGDWPGFVEPTATSSQLRAAKQAWRDAYDKKRYRLS